MSDFKPGLEGVIAFESEIAEPDREGGALRYRGVDIEELVGHVSYGHVWGLLVDNAFAPGLPPAEPYPIPVHSGDIRVDVQSALAMLAPAWGLRPLPELSRYRTPITSLYLTGSGSHPGGGITGIPGRNAALEVLKDLGHAAPRKSTAGLVRNWLGLYRAFRRFRRMTADS